VALAVHRLAHWALAGATLALLATAVLGWRLTQGPIDIPLLARAIENAANAQGGETRLEVGRVALGWEGLQGAGMTPLELRLSGVRLLGADGAMRAELPDAGVSLSIPWLLKGELAPRRLALHQPTLRLRRAEDGTLSALLGEPPAGGAPAEPPPGVATLETLIAELMRPPTEATPRGALALLAVTNARVFVEDAQLGAAWSLEDASFELRRLPGGGVTGRGAGQLRLGEARVPVGVTAEATGAPASIALRATLPEIHPAALARLAPALAPLAALDAPARIEASGRLDEAGVLREAGATLVARGGALDLGAGRRIPIAGLDAALDWTPETIRLPRAAIRLDGPGQPLLGAEATARRTGAGWQAEARLTLDAAPIEALPRWWPEGLGGNEREWILENITHGIARNGSWRITAEAGPDLSATRITHLAGELEVVDATVHWLRPIPPVEGVRGTVAFSLNDVVARVATGRQAGTQVQARDGVVHVLFPDGQVPTADIQLGLAGPVPDVLAVLQHPRLRLFERRPLPLKDPAGTLDGRVSVALPLLYDLPIEQLRIRGQGRLQNVRLSDVVLGRGIERGQFDITVDTEQLRLAGNAVFAEIPVRLGVEMDFRSGPGTQVVSRETVAARPDARQLAALDLAHEDVVRGPIAVEVRSERRRNGQGRVAVRADLRDAQLMLEPFGWSKPAGQNAGADAVLRLQGENLQAIESFRIEAPSLLLRGNAAFARGARLERATINEAQVDASRFAGEARPPARPGAPWTVVLRGPVLDMRRVMADDTPGTAPPPASEPGPAVAVDGRFERVLLGPARELAAVEARVQLDGRGVVREGRLAGRAGPRGPFEAVIAPQGPRRALRLTAEDAGALLGAFGVLEHLEGGRLVVNGAYAHNGPGAPLSGAAEMENFAVRNAPGFAKLLQAMTFYGLVEALSGPGLNFIRLVAPFTLTPETLTLEEARAFSASLGLTAKGTLDRRRHRLAMEGTIVPAYIFNSLLGNIPLLGRLFSPETGGGVFAATFRLNGPMDDPQVSVNPLAALTPGFLRGLFGIGQSTPQPAQ
jgi:hypothetical protein